jgi:glycolate oxidase iron-sulfur subunit
MLVLAGCVQRSLAPRINAAAARLLDDLGISLIEVPGAGCCGALRFHLNNQKQGLRDMRRLIDSWWPYVEQGVEAIVMTASGCGVTVKEYGELLAHDEAYRDKAKRVSELTRDLFEVVAQALEGGAAPWRWPRHAVRTAFHAPCTLQHGQRLKPLAERVLRAAGFDLSVVPEAHLCCGSAGTYSMLQPELAEQLRARKVDALQSCEPELIITANIGCLHHLAGAAAVPVKHWAVAFEERIAGRG